MRSQTQVDAELLRQDSAERISKYITIFQSYASVIQHTCMCSLDSRMEDKEKLVLTFVIFSRDTIPSFLPFCKWTGTLN